MVNVTIKLGDENDNRPIFFHPYYSTVVTSQEEGMSLLTVKATDRDERENARVAYSLVKGEDRHYFSINSRLDLNSKAIYRPGVVVRKAVRSISDPLEHLVNQVEIRHQPSYLAN